MINITGITEVEPQWPTQAKIVFYDIERAKMLIRMWTYDLKQISNYLNSKDIERPTWMPCVAWKWKGQNHVNSVSVLKDKERFNGKYWDDYLVVKTLHDVLSHADIAVGHNADNFDWKVFNARCLFHGLSPAPKPLMVDTLKVARKNFKIESNKLSYLADYLGVESKDDAPDWNAVAEGNVEAIEYCERYCRQDVRPLEAIYERMLPWMDNHPNVGLYMENCHHDVCPKCGSAHVIRNGFRMTQACKYIRMQCKSCGGYFKGKRVK